MRYVDKLIAIGQSISTVIESETGAKIEVSFVRDDEFSVSGTPADVEKALPFFRSATLDSIERYDDDPDLAIAFFTY